MTAAGVRCPRCGESVDPGHGPKWPEGILCRRCYRHATGRYGRCPRCLTDRLLPGLSPTGTPICSDCCPVSSDVRQSRHVEARGAISLGGGHDGWSCAGRLGLAGCLRRMRYRRVCPRS